MQRTYRFFLSFPLSSLLWRDISCSRIFEFFSLLQPPSSTLPHVVASRKRSYNNSSFFSFCAHLSIRCCFDNETWFECTKNYIHLLLLFFASLSLLCNITRRDFWLGDKSSIIFNFHARFPRLFPFVACFFYVLALASVAFVWTWIYIKENRSEIPRLRFFCLVLRLILFEFIASFPFF